MGEGEGGMIWGNGIETCIISYKKRITSPGLMQDALGCAVGGPGEMVQGGRGEGGSRWGTRVCPWWIHVEVWQNQYNTVN